jgi:hypothetical protein
MLIYARMNQIGWIHLWRTPAAYQEGEASEHFFNARTDPRWREQALTPEQQARLAAGELLELEDPGYLDEEPEIP